MSFVKRKTWHLAWVKVGEAEEGSYGLSQGPTLAPINGEMMCLSPACPEPLSIKVGPCFTSALESCYKVSLAACADIEQGSKENGGNKISSIPIHCTVLLQKVKYFF